MPLPAAPVPGGRITVSLDGIWQIDESLADTDVPRAYRHEVPVPGLANLAAPPFIGVDLFDSRESLRNRSRFGELPQSELTEKVGIPRQNRTYFWYHRTFQAPARKAVAILKINKAQFGTAVWLNGKKIGEHLGCFDPGYFDLGSSIDWAGSNDLVIRIGAHPGALPETAPAGTDQEKRRWTPGIYDSVSLLLSDNPFIESTQVAPRIAGSEILVETRFKNYGPAVSFELTHRVKSWKEGREAGRSRGQKLSLKAGEETVQRTVIRIPGATLWTPEDPFLYVVETSTGGDSLSTRFGMREFRFDTATQRAYLNGKVYFMRGSNITLHRFFEDPSCGRLPWDEPWVRKLLIDIPKKMHWNSFRFCIGPVPDKWLDIADEAGLLIQNEFFIWGYHKTWDAEELARQFKGWMQDNWNHPSVAIWDASNETLEDTIGQKIIPAVRSLDISGRPWENSYNLPSGPDDPVENHPYLFSAKPGFEMTDLETMDGFDRPKARHSSSHARILNEFDWLWLNRDGTPTVLTQGVYDKLLGADATPEQRFSLGAYLWAGLTEFWRAHRNYAAVLHFVYLTASYPGAYTSDHFLDVKNLKLEPHFEDYMAEVFSPLGVYINFWQPALAADSDRRFLVMLINDGEGPVEGKLALSLESAGQKELVRRELPFALGASGQFSYNVDLHIPKASGDCLLKATATPEGARRSVPTVSRRRVSIR
ncbi:putative Glycosyl hydrolase family 2 [Candidatus Sulfopaludibacter sp. SbA4]|nr:putative Glycosyl hydrolase family 2 [Candidatus Sulfopaludibacter sp. SbA4]